MKIFSHLQHGFSYKPVLYLDHLPHLFKMIVSQIVKAENKGSHKEWVYPGNLNTTFAQYFFNSYMRKL